MNTSDWIATSALATSLVSLTVSAFQYKRDSARLKLSARIIEPLNESPPYIQVTAVNRGRRPIVLQGIGGYWGDGQWQFSKLRGTGGGLQLGENERYSEDLQAHDLFGHSELGHVDQFEYLIAVDSADKFHKIKGSEILIIETLKARQKFPPEDVAAD